MVKPWLIVGCKENRDFAKNLRQIIAITGYEWSQNLLLTPKVNNITKIIIPKNTQMIQLNFQPRPLQLSIGLASLSQEPG